MNDVTEVTGLPPGVAEALAFGTLGDPFAVLGPHDTATGRIVRAFLPGAQGVEVLARAGDKSLGRLAPTAPHGLFEGRVSSGATVSAAHRLAGRGAGDRGSVFLRAAARRTRSASVQRRPAFRTGVASRRQRGDHRRRHRRALRRLGAECARRLRGRRFQYLGSAAQSDAAALSVRRVGAVHPASRAGRALQVSPSSVRTARVCRTRPIRWRARPSRRPPPRPSSPIPRRTSGTTRRGCGNARAAMRTDAPISIYEMHAASWFHPDGRIPTWDELAERLVPYVQRDGLHAISS